MTQTLIHIENKQKNGKYFWTCMYTSQNSPKNMTQESIPIKKQIKINNF